MNVFLRMGLLVAVSLSAATPIWAAPSDSDLGFAPSAGVGEGENIGEGTAGTGKQSYESRKMVEREMYWGDSPDQGNQSQYKSRNGKLKGEVWPVNRVIPAKTDKTRGGSTLSTNTEMFKPVPKGDLANLKAVTGLLAPDSVSGIRFDGKQKLGFPNPKGPTDFAQTHIGNFFRLPATGTGSVDLSITSKNGKD